MPDSERPTTDPRDPLYPQQPEDGERPLPLRAMPERTQEPQDWRPGVTDAVMVHRSDTDHDELLRRTADERSVHAAGGAGERAPQTDDESSYTTEQEQGAAQPGPDGSERADDRPGQPE